MSPLIQIFGKHLRWTASCVSATVTLFGTEPATAPYGPGLDSLPIARPAATHGDSDGDADWDFDPRRPC